MKKNPTTILAINPGTRYTGIAVLQGSELLDWGVKAANGKWSERKLEMINRTISNLIDEYQPDVLVIKRHHPSRSSTYLDRLTGEITNLAKENRIRVLQHTHTDIEVLCRQEGKTAKQEIAETVSLHHPILLRELRKEQDAYNPYHIRMFEAVALGMLVATAGMNH